MNAEERMDRTIYLLCSRTRPKAMTCHDEIADGFRAADSMAAAADAS